MGSQNMVLFSFSDYIFKDFICFLFFFFFKPCFVVRGWAVHCLNTTRPKLEIRVNSFHLRADTSKISPVKFCCLTRDA